MSILDKVKNKIPGLKKNEESGVSQEVKKKLAELQERTERLLAEGKDSTAAREVSAKLKRLGEKISKSEGKQSVEQQLINERERIDDKIKQLEEKLGKNKQDEEK